jgi:hypothetical protein
LRNQISWVLAPCSWVTFADLLKKRIAFIFSLMGELLTLKMKVVLCFEEAGTNCATTRSNKPEDLVLNTKTRFKLTQPLSAVSFPASNAANFPHDLAVYSF